MNKVMSCLFKAMFLICIISLYAGCGTFVIEEQPPQIPEAGNFSHLGIVQFSTYIEYEYGSDDIARIILSEPGDQDPVLEAAGLKQQMIPAKEPEELFSRYKVTENDISRLSQLAWEEVLSGKRAYQINMVEGFAGLHQMSSKDKNGVQIEGIKKISIIPETVIGMPTAAEINHYKEKYNIDSLLAGEVTIFGKIYQATSIPEKDTTRQSRVTFGDGEYVLFLDIYYDCAVYDTVSGNHVAQLNKTDMEIGPAVFPEEKLHALPVPAGDVYRLNQYLNSREYETFILDLLAEEASIFGYMLLPHSHGYFKSGE